MKILKTEVKIRAIRFSLLYEGFLLKKFKKILGNSKSNKEIEYKTEIARSHLENGRFTEAEVLYKEIKAIDSKSLEALINLSMIYINTNRLKEAEEVLIEVLKINSNNPKARVNLASIYEATGRLEEAAKEFMEALKINEKLPKKGEMEKLTDPVVAWKRVGLISTKIRSKELATVAITKIMKFYPNHFVDFMKELGELHVEQQSLDGAVYVFETILKIEKEDPSVYYNLGTIYSMKREFDKAEINFKLALKLDPTNAQFYHNLGYIKTNAQLYDDAREFFQKSVEIQPKYPLAWASLLLNLKNTNRDSELVITFERAIEALKSNVDDLILFIDQLRKIGMDEYTNQILTLVSEIKNKHDPNFSPVSLQAKFDKHTFLNILQQIGKDLEANTPQQALNKINEIRTSVELTEEGKIILVSLEAYCFYQLENYKKAFLNLISVIQTPSHSEYQKSTDGSFVTSKNGGPLLHVKAYTLTEPAEEETEIDSIDLINTLLKLLCEYKAGDSVAAKETLAISKMKFPSQSFMLDIMFQGLIRRNEEAMEMFNNLVNFWPKELEKYTVIEVQQLLKSKNDESK